MKEFVLSKIQDSNGMDSLRIVRERFKGRLNSRVPRVNTILEMVLVFFTIYIIFSFLFLYKRNIKETVPYYHFTYSFKSLSLF